MLSQELARRIQANPGYSLRAFARDLGVSHSYLSLVINGKRKLSPQKIALFSAKLGSPEASLSSLRGKRTLKKRTVRKQVLVNEYSNLFQAFANWYIPSLAVLVTTSNFKNSSQWISRKLGINPYLVGEALRVLSELKLVQNKDGKLQKTDHHLEVSPKESLASIRLFHEQIMKKAIETMKDTSQLDYKKRSITTDLIAVNPSHIPKVKRKIEKFRQEIVKELAEGDATEVMALGVQLFPLTRFG